MNCAICHNKLGPYGRHHVIRGTGVDPETICLECFEKLHDKEHEADINHNGPIAHPNHYTWLPGIECFDVVKHFPFCLGAAIKYIWRAGRKADNSATQDLRKAIANIEKHIELLESTK